MSLREIFIFKQKQVQREPSIIFHFIPKWGVTEVVVAVPPLTHCSFQKYQMIWKCVFFRSRKKVKRVGVVHHDALRKSGLTGSQLFLWC